MESIPTKVCTTCQGAKPATTEFFQLDKRRGTLSTQCRPCLFARRDPEKMRAHRRAYAARQLLKEIQVPEKKKCPKCQLLLCAECFSSSPKRSGGLEAYCKPCTILYKRSRAALKVRVHTPIDPVKKREINQRYRAKHLDRVRKSARDYNARNPDKVKASKARRRALEANAEGSHTSADIRSRYAAQRGLCYWCKKAVGGKYHLDHIFALAKGGGNGPGNLCIACAACNMAKKAKEPLDFSGRLM